MSNNCEIWDFGDCIIAASNIHSAHCFFRFLSNHKANEYVPPSLVCESEMKEFIEPGTVGFEVNYFPTLSHKLTHCFKLGMRLPFILRSDFD